MGICVYLQRRLASLTRNGMAGVSQDSEVGKGVPITGAH